jgi:hypothetical protein
MVDQSTSKSVTIRYTLAIPRDIMARSSRRAMTPYLPICDRCSPILLCDRCTLILKKSLPQHVRPITLSHIFRSSKTKCYPISITIVHTRWAYPCKGSALYWASSIIYSIDFASYPTIGVPSRVQIFQRVLHELQITSRVLNSSTNKNSQSPHLQFLGIRLIHVVTNRTSVASYGSIKKIITITSLR